MKIIEPKIIIQPYNGLEIMKNLERAMRVCYRSEGMVTDDSYNRLLKTAIDGGHESVLEHEKISILMTCSINCYDKETLILTENGWKYFKDLNIAEKVYSLDNNNNVVLVPVDFIISKHYTGEMYHFRNTTLDICVTPDHNMWVYDEGKRSNKTKIWKFLKASEMTNNIYKFNKIGNKEEINVKRYIKIPDKVFSNGCVKVGKLIENEIFFELLGWFITDGSLNKQKGSSYAGLRLHQKKHQGIQRLQHLLQIAGIEFTYHSNNNTFTVHHTPLGYYFEDICYKDNDNNKSANAFVPNIVRRGSTNEIKAFLRGVIGGNGYEKKNGGKCIYTGSEKFAQDLVELLFKVGYTSSYSQCPNLNNYNKSFKQTRPCYCVYIFRSTEISYWVKNSNTNKGPNFIKEFYNDKVYCVQLPIYHRVFVMRNGKTAWCGQCYKDLTRHRAGVAFSIESTRWNNYSKGKFGNELTYINPKYIDDEFKYSVWENCMQSIEDYYMDMAKVKAKPDELRTMLPHSIAAEVYMTANIREWRHILKLRTNNRVHPEIRQLLIPLLLKFKKDMPVLFDDISYDEDFNKEWYADIEVKDLKEIDW